MAPPSVASRFSLVETSFQLRPAVPVGMTIASPRYFWNASNMSFALNTVPSLTSVGGYSVPISLRKSAIAPIRVRGLAGRSLRPMGSF